MDERVWGSAIVGCSQARVSDGFRARPLWDVLGLGFGVQLLGLGFLTGSRDSKKIGQI